MFRSILLLVTTLLLAGPIAAAPAPNAVQTESITIDPLVAPVPETETPNPAGKGDAKINPTDDPSTSGGSSPSGDRHKAEDVPDDTPIPEIHYGETGLPAPVQRMRDALIEAAETGDIGEMRAVLEMNEVMPTLSFGDITDPIEHLKKTSGDGEGREVLAILLEVLNAGWVHMDKGKPQEMYIWPYFAQYPLDKLTSRQMVELFKIVTSYDYKEMQTYGAYIFYRVGIGPDGTLHYFVAGD